MTSTSTRGIMSFWGERGPRTGRAAAMIGVAALVTLAVAAASSDRLAGIASLPTLLDVAVGVAFPAAAFLSPCATRQRWLISLVGAAWLLASVVPLTVPLHRALLLVALLSFPTGRLSRVRAVTSMAAVLLVVVGTQRLTALAFTLVAAVAVVSVGQRPAPWRWYPFLAAAALATEQLVASVAAAATSADVWLLLYEAVLVSIALGHVIAAQDRERQRTGPVDLLLASRLSGVGQVSDRLSDELGDALDDPALRVLRWSEEAAAYVDGDGRPVPASVGSVRVEADRGPLAVVESTSELLSDPRTAATVIHAVRLAIAADEGQRELVNRLAELEETRAALLRAADLGRVTVAERLQHEVLPYLAAASDGLAHVNAHAGSAAAVAREELDAARRDLADLVTGLPPADLGEGRLVAALQALARRSPIAVDVRSSPGWCAPSELEQALYYVAAEAHANALKHSGARTVVVTLSHRDGEVALSVADSGCGGADASGSGLQGLADRLAVHRGVLAIDSRRGAGTTVTARLPYEQT